MEITKKTIQKQIDFLGNLYCRASDQSHIDKLDELYEVLKYVQDDLVPTIERGKALLYKVNGEEVILIPEDGVSFYIDELEEKLECNLSKDDVDITCTKRDYETLLVINLAEDKFRKLNEKATLLMNKNGQLKVYGNAILVDDRDIK